MQGTGCFKEKCPEKKLFGLDDNEMRYETFIEMCVPCPKVIPQWGNPYGLLENINICLDY